MYYLLQTSYFSSVYYSKNKLKKMSSTSNFLDFLVPYEHLFPFYGQLVSNTQLPSSSENDAFKVSYSSNVAWSFRHLVVLLATLWSSYTPFWVIPFVNLLLHTLCVFFVLLTFLKKICKNKNLFLNNQLNYLFEKTPCLPFFAVARGWRQTPYLIIVHFSMT